MSSEHNKFSDNADYQEIEEDAQASTISGIYKAFKDVHEASRATSQAERELKELQGQIKDDKRVLKHRQEIDANFDKIIQEQTSIVVKGLESKRKIDDITEDNTAKRTELVRKLDKTIQKNRSELEPFRTASDQAQAALDEAARQLAIFKRTEQSSRQHLQTLINQRDKQTKNLKASIEASEDIIFELKQKAADPYDELTARDKLDLREKIAIEQKKLGEYKESLRRIETSAQKNIVAVEDSMAEETLRLENTKSRHDEVKKEAEHKLKRLEEKSEQCRKLEEELQKEIDEVEAYQKTLDDHNNEIENAIEEARGLIREAHDIHENPEVTKDLALRIMRDEMAEKEMISHVEELQEFEDELLL